MIYVATTFMGNPVTIACREARKIEDEPAYYVEISIDGGEWLPFGAMANDPEKHGRDIFAALNSAFPE